MILIITSILVHFSYVVIHINHITLYFAVKPKNLSCDFEPDQNGGKVVCKTTKIYPNEALCILYRQPNANVSIWMHSL